MFIRRNFFWISNELNHILFLSIWTLFLPFQKQAKKAKQAEIERKRAEVRKRMEEASKAKKAKKGFMTPERKKKLRVSIYRLPHIKNELEKKFQNFFAHFLFIEQLLLRKKAAEELKKEQERKAAERRRIIEERCGKPKQLESANEGMYISLVMHLMLIWPSQMRLYYFNLFQIHPAILFVITYIQVFFFVVL